MNKIFNGFLLGVGFSIAFAICMAVWTLTAAPRIEAIFNETYDNIKSDFELSMIEALKLKVTKTIVKDDQIVVSYSMVNMGQSSLAARYTVRFSLLTNNGTLIGNCDNPIPEIYTDSELFHFSSTCSDLMLPANDFADLTISVIRNRDQLEFTLKDDVG
jgi:hypothetical protein